MKNLHFAFFRAYRVFRCEYEDAASCGEVYRCDLLGLWLAGGEL
jgi:hypothetical protein